MIEVTNVSKHYGNFQAVRDVSFSVGRVEVLGFLGPNGAGKTTIMKILTGYHFPSSGEVKIDGINAAEDPVAVKNRIGYLPESVPLYGDMSPQEYLLFAASARLLPVGERQKAVDKALAACGIDGAARTQRIDSLSKGYRQRLGLAQAIIHDPPILILDEPTSGLDPNQIIEIRALIRELGKRKAVILSTHILQEVEAVCSRILILNEGRIAAQGTPEEIARSMATSAESQAPTEGQGSGGADTWEVHLKGADAAEAQSRLARLDLPAGAEITDIFAENLETAAVRLCFTIKGGGAASSGGESGELIFNWAVSQGYRIINMNRRKLSVEDIFVEITKDIDEEI
ncbi:MAG: ABC transporter ATP-binding protein [Treponema sp.]|nr:ABC transporter ATP-binding protein [Treponema sp.]